jgi:hypothetical protein
MNLPYGREFIGYEKPKKLDTMIKYVLERLGVKFAEEGTNKELDEKYIWDNIINYFEENKE